MSSKAGLRRPIPPAPNCIFQRPCRSEQFDRDHDRPGGRYVWTVLGRRCRTAQRNGMAGLCPGRLSRRRAPARPQRHRWHPLPVHADGGCRDARQGEAGRGAVNWTGLYLGVIGGTEYGHGALTFPGVASTDVRPAGMFGGGTVGYNVQAANWVYGIEGDLAGAGADASSACTPLFAGPTNTALFQMNCHDHSDWVATVAARLGLLLTPRVLTYAKAGGARRERDGFHVVQSGHLERDPGGLAELRESGWKLSQRRQRESHSRRMDGRLRFGVCVHVELDGQGGGRLARLRQQERHSCPTGLW